MLKGEFLDIEVLDDSLDLTAIQAINVRPKWEISFAVSPFDEINNVAFFIMTFSYMAVGDGNANVYFKFKSRVTYRLFDVQAPVDLSLLAELVFDGYDRVKMRFKNIVEQSVLLEGKKLPELTMAEIINSLTKTVAAFSKSSNGSLEHFN